MIVKPLYDSYCFSRLPETIKYLFGLPATPLPMDVLPKNPPYETVILFFVDAFGWRFFERYASRIPFLRRLQEEGIVKKITSQFPSTTAGHVTCINTGLEVGQSGVYEWFYYDPRVDDVIAPLLYSFARDKKVNTLETTGITPQELYPTETIYQELKKGGVHSYAMQHASIANSPYSQVMLQGANNVPFTHLSQALERLLEMSTYPSPRYFILYWGDIDAAGHRHGVDSPQFEKAVTLYWELIEKFWNRLSVQKGKCVSIFVADHGMISVDPKTTVYLNKRIPNVHRYFKKNLKGREIVPAGSCRDFFLHIEEERLEETTDIFRETLGEIATVIPTQQLIGEGFFGSKTVSQRFLQRVGNLLILPKGNHSVWWYEKHHFEQNFYGAHGGLSPEEMETICLSIEK